MYTDIFNLNNVGCSQPVLSINGQQNNIYIISGTVITFKVCGEPNTDFIIQNVETGDNEIGWDTNLFYPYNVIDRGKLDSDGIYLSSIPLNRAGTYVFRVGVWCTVAEINYCTKVSNTVTVIVMGEGCTPNWQCKQPLDNYEYDANYCGQTERIASRCKPECGGTGCDSGSESKSNFLKIGMIVAITWVSLYFLEEREKRKRKR